MCNENINNENQYTNENQNQPENAQPSTSTPNCDINTQNNTNTSTQTDGASAGINTNPTPAKNNFQNPNAGGYYTQPQNMPPYQNQYQQQHQQYQYNYQNPNQAQYNYQYNAQFRQPVHRPQPSGYAIASMVLGIISILLSCIYYVSLASAVISIILGIVCIKKSLHGKSMAVAGIIMSSISFALILIWLVVYGFILVRNSSSIQSEYFMYCIRLFM